MNTNTITTYTPPTPQALAIDMMAEVVMDALCAVYPLPSSHDDDYDCEDYGYEWDQTWSHAESMARDLLDYGMTVDEVRSLGTSVVEIMEWAYRNSTRIEAIADCVAL